MNTGKDNLQILAELQEKHTALEKRMKEIDTNSLEFKDAFEYAKVLSKEIDSIMKVINEQNNNLSRLMNTSQEHVIGEYLSQIK